MKIRIMVSSTRADLMQYRKEAARIIAKIAEDVKEKHQIIDDSMEKQLQTGDREFAVEVSKKWVEKADWIVLIIGWNYGTISHERDAKGLSVTEWEYSHAIELKKTNPNKKVFVFVAGARDSTDPYKYTEEEKVDLKDWMGEQDEHQRQQLERFKKELSQPHTELFRNLAHFRERLETTLRHAIDDLPPDIQPGSHLAELILEVKPEFVKCLDSVKLLAISKDIHDKLHDLRQKVISPLEDQILLLWRQQNHLSTSQRNILNKRAMQAERLLGRIEEFARRLNGDSQDLKNHIDRLVKSNLFDPEINPEPSLEEFIEKIDNFASDVQHAFTEADEAMLGRQGALNALHSVLLERIGKAREERYLFPEDEKTLDEELKKTARNRLRVTSALNLHHRWQKLHNGIEHLHRLRDTNNFSRRLRYFVEKELPTLTRLVDDELRALESEIPAADDGAIVAINNEDEQKLRDDLQQKLRDDLQQMKTYMTNLTERRDNDAFDEMRKSFDEVFYRVDKRTLSEVDRARDRVEGFERLIDNLARDAQQRAV